MYPTGILPPFSVQDLLGDIKRCVAPQGWNGPTGQGHIGASNQRCRPVQSTSPADRRLTGLRRLAALDLGDFFRFEYASHTDSLGGRQQAYTEGVRVNFDVYLGVNKKDRLSVALVVKAVVTDTPETIIPSNLLPLPKLPQCKYRMYPLVDQMADKVCATLSVYNGYPSTRVKDLVDLVVLTLTQAIDGGRLEVAITREAASRGLPLPETFTAPPDWDASYRKLASPIPDCKDHFTVTLATSLVNALLEPVLARKTKGLRWDPGIRAWV